MIAKRDCDLAQSITDRLDGMDVTPESDLRCELAWQCAKHFREIYDLSVPLANMIHYGYVDKITEDGRELLREGDGVLAEVQRLIANDVPGPEAVILSAAAEAYEASRVLAS